jgi:hypothetical protein
VRAAGVRARAASMGWEVGVGVLKKVSSTRMECGSWSEGAVRRLTCSWRKASAASR